MQDAERIIEVIGVGSGFLREIKDNLLPDARLTLAAFDVYAARDTPIIDIPPYGSTVNPTTWDQSYSPKRIVHTTTIIVSGSQRDLVVGRLRHLHQSGFKIGLDDRLLWNMSEAQKAEIRKDFFGE